MGVVDLRAKPLWVNLTLWHQTGDPVWMNLLDIMAMTTEGAVGRRALHVTTEHNKEVAFDSS